MDSAETSEATTQDVVSEKTGVAPAEKTTTEEPSQDEEKSVWDQFFQTFIFIGLLLCYGALKTSFFPR